MNIPALQVDNLFKTYGKKTILGGISFSVYPGEIVGFLGPNGAGKTTTLEILVGLRKKTAGTIELFGSSVTYPLEDALKSRIGISFQASGVYEDLTVWETLQLFAALYTEHTDLDELLAAVSLQEEKKKRVKYLSGGQKQRLVFAISIINNPDIVFLDEPTVGLDPRNRREIWKLILQLKEEKKAVILTSHYMDEIEALADRIIFLHHGKIQVNGTVDDVKKLLGNEVESLEDAIIELENQ